MAVRCSLDPDMSLGGILPPSPVPCLPLNSENILVVGATGGLGSAMVAHLAKDESVKKVSSLLSQRALNRLIPIVAALRVLQEVK